MPVKPCRVDGKPGRKWGDEGKCYPCRRDGDGWDCSDAERKAKRQGRAIEENLMEFVRDREAFTTLANKAGLVPRDNWYEIDNRADETATIFIYSDIGWFGATAEEFVAELKDITASNIEVRINSYGGSVFEGIAIFNALRAHPAKITTQVDAIAASIASVIVQAGDHRIMLDSSEMMLHEATGIAIGATADNMRELADILDNQTTKIAEIYAARADDDHTVDDFLELMRAGTSNLGTWFSAAEAVDQNLADEVVVPASQPEDRTPTAKAPTEPAAASDPEPDPEPEPEPVAVDFSDLFNTDPDDFEWSTPTKKEALA